MTCRRDIPGRAAQRLVGSAPGRPAYPELSFTPGWKNAGTAREDAGGLMAGDRVAAMPNVGGFGETVAADGTWSSRCQARSR